MLFISFANEYDFGLSIKKCRLSITIDFSQALTFYDIVLDYILLDAFEDLASPPSSVLAVVRNRWLSDGFKESVSNS